MILEARKSSEYKACREKNSEKKRERKRTSKQKKPKAL